MTKATYKFEKRTESLIIHGMAHIEQFVKAMNDRDYYQVVEERRTVTRTRRSSYVYARRVNTEDEGGSLIGVFINGESEPCGYLVKA